MYYMKPLTNNWDFKGILSQMWCTHIITKYFMKKRLKRGLGKHVLPFFTERLNYKISSPDYYFFMAFLIDTHISNHESHIDMSLCGYIAIFGLSRHSGKGLYQCNMGVLQEHYKNVGIC